MTGLIIGVRCHYCSKHRNPHEIVRFSGGPIMCWHCYEWHTKALLALAGEPPPGCQDCGSTFASLKAASGDGNVRMSVVVKDGVYAVLCHTCADAYCQKRSDLFRSTEYGHRKLKL